MPAALGPTEVRNHSWQILASQTRSPTVANPVTEAVSPLTELVSPAMSASPSSETGQTQCQDARPRWKGNDSFNMFQ